MAVRFRFRKVSSAILGKIYRPVAQVFFQPVKSQEWLPVMMMVDSGADYTLLPKWYAEALNIDLVTDCQIFETLGVGGTEWVYLYKKEARVKLGRWEREVTLGFLAGDRVPPLLGRHQFMETFRTTFSQHQTIFEENEQ